MTEVVTYDDPEEIIEELFESLLSRYKIGLDMQMRGSNFIFDFVNLIYYKCHKINFDAVVHILIFWTGKKTKKQQ